MKEKLSLKQAKKTKKLKEFIKQEEKNHTQGSKKKFDKALKSMLVQGKKK